MRLRFLLAMALGLFAAPASAQGVLPDVALTTERVEAVIAAFAPMRARLKEIDASFGSAADAGDYSSQLQALAFAGSANSVLDDAARDNGFASVIDWINHTNAVLLAHAFAENSTMNVEMQQTLADIDNQPGLSAEQKEQMKAMLLQSMGALDSVRPSDANIASVTPYHDEIEAIIAE